jgi:hypothetical protein
VAGLVPVLTKLVISTIARASAPSVNCKTPRSVKRKPPLPALPANARVSTHVAAFRPWLSVPFADLLRKFPKRFQTRILNRQAIRPGEQSLANPATGRRENRRNRAGRATPASAPRERGSSEGGHHLPHEPQPP